MYCCSRTRTHSMWVMSTIVRVWERTRSQTLVPRPYGKKIPARDAWPHLFIFACYGPAGCMFVVRLDGAAMKSHANMLGIHVGTSSSGWQSGWEPWG